jgi:phosphatidate cytidylyltransferase
MHTHLTFNREGVEPPRNIMSAFQDTPQRIITSAAILIIISVAYIVDTYVLGSTIFILSLIAAVGILAYVIEWPRFRQNENPVLWQLLGLLYIVPPLIATYQLWVFKPVFLLWLVLITISADVGAYFTGRLVGGPKLWPSVSPGKTQSGALGGIAAALLVSVIFWGIVGPFPNLFRWPGLLYTTFVLTLAGIGGDLFESWLKRRVGRKDSSNLLPGHGGLLDRLDSHLIVLPLGAMIAF